LIDKHRKNCLWRGRDFRNKGYNLTAWDLVRLPKKKGGLGVINLTIQNDALLLKQLDKFYKKENVQWVNLIWQKYYPSTVPHLALFGGKISLDCTFAIEVLQFALLVLVTLWASGRT
jgi:hypothetical protein